MSRTGKQAQGLQGPGACWEPSGKVPAITYTGTSRQPTPISLPWQPAGSTRNPVYTWEHDWGPTFPEQHPGAGTAYWSLLNHQHRPLSWAGSHRRPLFHSRTHLGSQLLPLTPRPCPQHPTPSLLPKIFQLNRPKEPLAQPLILQTCSPERVRHFPDAAQQGPDQNSPPTPSPSPPFPAISRARGRREDKEMKGVRSRAHSDPPHGT